MRDEPQLAKALHPALPICGAQVVWAVRQEMARTLDDVLARRTRALFLNATAALAMASSGGRTYGGGIRPESILADQQFVAFKQVAAHFIVRPDHP